MTRSHLSSRKESHEGRNLTNARLHGTGSIKLVIALREIKGRLMQRPLTHLSHTGTVLSLFKIPKTSKVRETTFCHLLVNKETIRSLKNKNKV